MPLLNSVLIDLQSAKFILTGAAPTLTNGIVAPWMYNATGLNFLSYNNETGFTNAAFTSSGSNAAFFHRS